MTTKLARTCVVFAALFGSVAIADDAASVGTSATVFVKDSAITTKIQSKLAVDHLTSLGRIHVETDRNGIVWLTGTARSQQAINKAVSLAKGTENVQWVHNDLTVQLED